MKKVLIIEDEYEQLENSFNYINDIYFNNELQYKVVTKSQEIVPFSSICNYDYVFVDIKLAQDTALDGYGILKKIEADSNNAQKIIVNNATLKKAESKTLDCSSVTTKFVFHGIYSKLSGSVMVENGYYSMSKGKFAKATDPNGNLNGLRWYLEAIDRTTGESSLAKTGEISIVAIDEDEVTGIANIENGSDNKIVSIFDANGRKMNGFQKGLNIVKYSNGTTKKIMK